MSKLKLALVYHFMEIFFLSFFNECPFPAPGSNVKPHTHLPERDILKKLIIENIDSNNYLKSLYSLQILAMKETFHIDNNQMYNEIGKVSVGRQLQGRGVEHGCEREDRYKSG